jgi:predicted dehydrogenase
MDRIRIGIIGLGWFGEIHCDAIASVPNLELVALCTRRPDRLAELAMKYNTPRTYRDYSDLLADSTIDAVSIVTMWDQHTEPAVADIGQTMYRFAGGADDRHALVGALREEFSYFANCAATGAAPAIGRPEDAAAALEATLGAEESARTGTAIRIGG